MIRQIFLGKPWHWALMAVAAGLLWYCGSKRLHVIEFNLFIIGLLVGFTASVFAIVWFHREGEQVTREPLVAHVPGPDDGTGPARD